MVAQERIALTAFCAFCASAGFLLSAVMSGLVFLFIPAFVGSVIAALCYWKLKEYFAMIVGLALTAAVGMFAYISLFI